MGILFSDVYRKAIALFDDPRITTAYETNPLQFNKIMYTYLQNAISMFNNPLSVSLRLSQYKEPKGIMQVFEGDGKNNKFELDPEFEIQDNPGTFNDRINSCYKSLSLLEMIDESVVLVHDYPDNGRLYYDIINLYYMGISENSHEDVMEMLDLTRATYYRSHKKALECFYLHFITVLKKANYTFDTQKLLNEYA